jgi:small conductance mechanosensitive channel
MEFNKQLFLDKYEIIKLNTIEYAPKVILTFIIIISTYFLANYYKNNIVSQGNNNLTKEEIQKHKVNLLYYQMSRIIYYLILFIGFTIAVINLGISSASILTILGTLGLAMALALQGTITNITSGVYITLNNLFNIGDIIKVNNNIGIIKSFNLFNTVIIDENNNVSIIPNSMIQNNIVSIL